MRAERQRTEGEQLCRAYSADEDGPGRLGPDQPDAHRIAPPVAPEYRPGAGQLEPAVGERPVRLRLADHSERECRGQPGEVLPIQPGDAEPDGTEQPAGRLDGAGQGGPGRRREAYHHVRAPAGRRDRHRRRGGRQAEQPADELPGELRAQRRESADPQARLA